MTLRRMTDSGKLVDVEPLVRPSYDAGTELVPLDTETCPRCGLTLARESLWQDSLVRHGGYGATRRVDTLRCPAGHERIAVVATERPPRV